MATERTPWFRDSKDAWYVQYRGKQVRLAKGRENSPEAMKAFYRLMAADDIPATAEIRVVQVCDLFLEWSQRHHQPETYNWCKHYLQSFCSFKGNGGQLSSTMKPFHLTRWVDSNNWTGARRSSQQIVKRAFSWAKREGLIEANPFAAVRLPSIRSRDRLLTPTEQGEILSAVDDDEFRNYLTALQESGARPSEVARVTAADVDLALGIWVLTRHKTAEKTGKPASHLPQPAIARTHPSDDRTATRRVCSFRIAGASRSIETPSAVGTADSKRNYRTWVESKRTSTVTNTRRPHSKGVSAWLTSPNSSATRSTDMVMRGITDT